jgi:gliding motility-associated-like protein
MYRSILLALSLLFFITASKAAVFVVTSNADSGPGTLREALTLAAANGSAEKDFIDFNLPDLSEAGRTIMLASQLPDMTSNLAIDATTQPGQKFGITDAKIKIVFKFVYPDNLNVFYSNGADFIEIYGFWFDCDMTGWGGSTILTKNFNTVTIGAPAKGNFIERGNLGVDMGKVCYFQNNICWTDPTGEIARGGNMGFIGCDKVVMGGSVAAKNVIAGSVNFLFTNPDVSTLDLSYNILGANYTGTKAPYGFALNSQARVTIDGPILNTGAAAEVPINAIIKNNIIADVYAANLLQVSNVSGKIVVQGNAFNTDFTGTQDLNQFSQSIAFAAIVMTIGVNAEVIIGGSNPSEKNLISHSQIGIEYAAKQNFTITRNSIFCVDYNSTYRFSDQSPLPVVKINSVSSTQVSGIATPNSDVELFVADCNCGTPPNPKTYFATIKADANGKWTYTGLIDSYIMASATLNNLTGFFQGLSIDDSKVAIQSASCSKKGSITGIVTPYTTGFRWYNSDNKLVATNLDLKDVDAGTYTLKIVFGTACEQTKIFTIEDKSVKVNVDNLQITKPTCSTKGSITGITVAPYDATYKWSDKSGTILCNCIDLYDIDAGVYTFTVQNADGTCKQTLGPYNIKRADGTNIDDSKPAITNTTCDQSTGSIKDILVTGGTGTRHFTWKNNLQQEVAYTQDLTGQPAGKYTLQVTDDTQCGPVYSKEIEIAEVNGISLTESTTPTTPASCGKANGAVSGVTATGGVKYEWRDVNGNLVGNSLDLTNVPGGGYQLTVSNAFCQKQSKVYQVLEQSGTVFPSTYTVNHIDACYGVSDGALHVNQDLLIKAVRWVNSAGVDVGMHNGVTGLPVGSYKLYLTDQNGCESYYNTYQVGQLPEYTVADDGQINNEICGLKNGNVQNVIIIGGLPPYTYKWLNANGEQIGSTNSISNLAAGVYTLNVVDSRCGNVDITYTIQSITQDLLAPSVSDLQVCSPGDALFFVNSPASNGVYRLYDQLNSTSPLAEQAGGSFKIDVTNNRSFFVSQVSGTCESARSEVKVSVGLSTINIANTFSPNGDGHNDYWKIDGIESYPQAVVQIFNRNGQKLFESKGYGTPFNGTYKGKPLPTGTYFYIINLNKNCNLLSGSLTIIR